MGYTAWILLTASLVGVSCGLVGTLLILRRMAMMADAISHTVLLGIVVVFLVTRHLQGVPMLIGAVLAGLLTAVLVQGLHLLGVREDASLGVVFTTLFALGVILIATKAGNVHLDVEHALMGEIAFIPWNMTTFPLVGQVPVATLTLLFVTLGVLLVILLFYKEWKITSFDPAMAASLGLPVGFIHYLFMSMVSVTAVASFDAVGAILVVAMLITPAAAAYLWTDRFGWMFVLSACFGIGSAFLGYYLALWLDTSVSGAMAFATGIIFLVSFLFSPKHGLIAKRVRPVQEEVK